MHHLLRDSQLFGVQTYHKIAPGGGVRSCKSDPHTVRGRLLADVGISSDAVTRALLMSFLDGNDINSIINSIDDGAYGEIAIAQFPSRDRDGDGDKKVCAAFTQTVCIDMH